MLGTFTIPIMVDVPLSTPYGNYDAVFTGSLQAASLPEPSTLALAALGGVGAAGDETPPLASCRAAVELNLA